MQCALLCNEHYCAMHMRSGPHARGTTMASSMRSEVLVRCGISVVAVFNSGDGGGEPDGRDSHQVSQ